MLGVWLLFLQYCFSQTRICITVSIPLRRRRSSVLLKNLAMSLSPSFLQTRQLFRQTARQCCARASNRRNDSEYVKRRYTYREIMKRQRKIFAEECDASQISTDPEEEEEIRLRVKRERALRKALVITAPNFKSSCCGHFCDTICITWLLTVLWYTWSTAMALFV